METPLPGSDTLGMFVYVFFYLFLFRRLKQPDASPLVYILVIFFGSSTWLGVTAVWVELPLMVSVYKLPEFWNLPSYLAVIVQLAVVGPIIYWLLKKIFPDFFANPTPSIYFCLGFCTLSTLFLAIFWDRTTYVAGVKHSTALFATLFCVSLVSCTSSILYLPTMFRFRPVYFTAYFIGMGISALVPSVLAIIQGSGQVQCIVVNATINNTDNFTISVEAQPVLPHFSVSVFYGLMFLWMCLATASFFALNVLPVCKREFNVKTVDEKLTEENPNEEKSLQSEPPSPESYKTLEKPEKLEIVVTSPTISTGIYAYLLILTFWCCALMNGILPSIQSFACLPYGTTVFHWAVILSNIANPTACFVPFFYSLKNVTVISLFSLFSTLFSVYIVILAAYSPTALLSSSDAGSAFCVLAWTFDIGLLAYLRAVCGGILRESGNEKHLFWCGIFTQAGSFAGAVLMFPLVNVYGYFHAASQC